MVHSAIYDVARDNGRWSAMQADRLDVLKRISAEIKAKRNEPQELWASLRHFMVADKAFAPLGLARDVIDFCLAVYDTLEPNAPFDERQKRIALTEAFVLLINPRMGRVVKRLSASFGIGLAMANGEE